MPDDEKPHTETIDHIDSHHGVHYLHHSTLHSINDEDNTSDIINFNQELSYFMVMLTFVASISGLMFGYDTGYISSALVSIGKDLDGKVLTYGNQEFITSATSLGALITATFSGVAADIVGRKTMLMTSNILFFVGAILQVTSHTLWQMIGGRLVMGFGVGIGSMMAPVYISEIAPRTIRGRLTVINSLCITGGQLVAYGIGAGLNKVHNGWRILVGLSMIPAALQLVAFFFLPDTPRFYVMKGKLDQARAALRKTYTGASDEMIELKIEELHRLNHAVPGSNPFEIAWNSIKEIHTVPSNFRALILGCGLQGVQQFTGFNSLLYFSGTVFQAVGFKDPVAVSIVIAATNFVFTMVAFFAIDKIGRRIILLIGIPGMTISLVICSIAFHFLGIKFTGKSADIPDGVNHWGVVVIVFMVTYVATYAMGIGTVPWQQSELFPQSVRGIGTSYSTATNWAGSLVISSTFLTMLQNITPTGTFAFFAGLCAVSFVFVWFCYPELSGLELEEVQRILTGGFNIAASKKLAKKRKQESKQDLESKPDHKMIEH